MVSKKVLKKIGVFAMTAILAAAPALAVSANPGGISLQAVGDGAGDVETGDNNEPGTPGDVETGDNNEPGTPGDVETGDNNKPGTPVIPSTPSSPASPSASTSSSASSVHVNYNVVTNSLGNKQVSTVNGFYFVTVASGVAVVTPYADVLTAFGAGAGSDVKVVAVDSEHGPAAGVSINDGLARLAADKVAAVKGPEVDINAYLNGQQVIDINSPITIAIGIPASFRQAGYDYAVIRVQEGGRVSILTDKDQDPDTITINTSGFGVYVLVKAPAGSFNKYN